MAYERLLVSLPAALARRFRSRVAAGHRSAFVQRLLEKALGSEAEDDSALFRIASEVEQDDRLSREMAEWDVTCGDGFEPGPADRSSSR